MRREAMIRKRAPMGFHPVPRPNSLPCSRHGSCHQQGRSIPGRRTKMGNTYRRTVCRGSRGSPTLECDVDPLRDFDVLVAPTPVRRVRCPEDIGYAALCVIPDFDPESAVSCIFATTKRNGNPHDISTLRICAGTCRSTAYRYSVPDMTISVRSSPSRIHMVMPGGALLSRRTCTVTKCVVSL